METPSRRRSSAATVFTTASSSSRRTTTTSPSRSSAVCMDLPSMFRELLWRVPGLSFPEGPVLSRHSYTRDIHSALIAAGHGRVVRRRSICSGAAMGGKVGEGDGDGHRRRSHAGVLLNERLRGKSTDVAKGTDGRDRGSSDDRDLEQGFHTQPRDVDALLSKMMFAGFERRARFPNLGNEVMWAEVGRHVDWLEGMPVRAVAELGVEIFNARREYLRGMRLREKVSVGTNNGKKAKKKTSGTKPQLREKLQGRTARIVDVWVEWREYILGKGVGGREARTWRDHLEYDDELYAPISKDVGAGYQADDENSSSDETTEELFWWRWREGRCQENRESGEEGT